MAIYALKHLQSFPTVSENTSRHPNSTNGTRTTAAVGSGRSNTSKSSTMTIDNCFFGPLGICSSSSLSLPDGKFHGQVVERSRSQIRSSSPDSALQGREVLHQAKLGGVLSHDWTKKQSDERNFLVKRSREGIRNAQRPCERFEIQGYRLRSCEMKKRGGGDDTAWCFFGQRHGVK